MAKDMCKSRASKSRNDWVVCQIGAREHYLLAAELHARKQLAALCTDAWAGPASTWRAVSSIRRGAGLRIGERFSPALENAHVLCETPFSTAVHSLRMFRSSARGLWPRTMETNRWFASRMAARLQREGILAGKSRPSPPIVFAYSYAALEILETAKRAGCVTVLGQIDPGPVASERVAEVARSHGFADTLSRPPDEYWDRWRREVELADVIVVNSPWSREAVLRAGVDARKISIAPLAYVGKKDFPTSRTFPKAFSENHPMEVLFLGQVNVHKGAVELLQAMQRLKDAPIRLTLVGTVQDGLKDHFAYIPGVRWVGSVPRSEAASYYSNAHVFVLPTHSDGFALTQLEAQAYGLPVFASKWCGEVVEDGVNGKLIDPVSPDAVEAVLRWGLDNTRALADMAKRAKLRISAFSPENAVSAILRAIQCRVE